MLKNKFLTFIVVPFIWLIGRSCWKLPALKVISYPSEQLLLFVDKVKSKNIDQKNHDFILELIGIDYMKNKNDYEINLIFKKNAHIALTTETIEVRLEDQNEIIENENIK